MSKAEREARRHSATSGYIYRLSGCYLPEHRLKFIVGHFPFAFSPSSTSRRMASDRPRKVVAESTHALEAGLAIQQRERKRLSATSPSSGTAEIERLLSFLDQSDEYVMTEREINGDEEEDSSDGEGHWRRNYKRRLSFFRLYSAACPQQTGLKSIYPPSATM